MDVSELRAMSDADLRDQYAESKRELFNLRMQLAARQLENFRRIREVRRDVARVLTVLGERSRAGGACRAKERWGSSELGTIERRGDEE